MRAFLVNLLLALVLAALGVTGSDIEPQLIEKGHFVEITVVTFPDNASQCYLVTPENINIDILSETLPDKYKYDPNRLSNCRVRINDLDKNDEGLWSLHAVVPGGDTVYTEQEYILIQESDTSESVSSEENSKQSAEDTAISEETPEGENQASAEHPATSRETDTLETTSEEDNKASAEHPGTSGETESLESTSEEDNKASAEHPGTSGATESLETTSEEDKKASAEHPGTSGETESLETTSEEDNKASAEHPGTSGETETLETTSEEDKKASAEHPGTSGETETLETTSEEDNKASAEHPGTSGETESLETTSEEDNKASAEHPGTSGETETLETTSEEDNKASAEHPGTSGETETLETTSEEDNKASAEHPGTSGETESLETTSEEDTKASAEHPVTSEETESSETTSEEGNKTSAEHPATSEEIESLEETSEEEEHTSTSREAESLEASSSEEEQGIDTQWLSDLRFITRTGLNVDINLPRTLNTEKCTLTKPDGTTVDINSDIPGVTAHSASAYVSCRVVVGPMEASLLGNWTLCGTYEQNNIEQRRCQNAEIVWRSTSNPGSMWQTTINAKFDHVVHFGGTLTPAVRGSGSVLSCHLVTPDDEDLFVTRDREYPNVRLVQNTDSACSIAIGPIVDSLLGDWAVYGTFDSALWGHNEVRQPINMELYDKDDPYAQAYNVTTLNPTQHVVNLGSTLPVEVTSTGAVDVCEFTLPSGQRYLSTGTMPTGVTFITSNRVACQLSIGPITENMIGDWLLIGKFSNRDVYTENRLTFTIIQEDPSNPIEEDRTVQNLDEQFFDTAIGASHRAIIASDIFSTFQSCHIRTPEGLQYTVMEGFHIPGVDVEISLSVACGVTVQVSEDLIGTWTLIAREIRSSQAIERRLPFVIYVEETVQALPDEISITEGNAMHVRLASPTDLHDTCKLHDPNDQEVASANSDDNHKDTCGFVVPSVDASHNGTWNIVYGTKIIYKAPVQVNVNARVSSHVQSLTWVEHASVSQIVGPEEAVYCRVLSPLREVMFDGFGRCQVTVDRVMPDQHASTWTMEVGLPGRIVTEQYQLYVEVIPADKKPEVSSSVTTNKPTVELTCSVTSPQHKTGCLFRGPAGEVLVANQGVSEERYVFHVNQTSIDSESYYYSCSLQITEPATSDLGLWRCDLESEEENYYGFLTVLCPWAMQDPVVAASVVTEPVLTAAVATLVVEEREPATLACSARAPLRYCYFRAPNGTIFNLQPGMSAPGMEYAGAGLDAGECGVRISSLLNSDSGGWSCHAGVNGSEQFHSIRVLVQEEFQLSASRERRVIEAQVAGARPVEYCRFVRFDGLGFTSDNAPYPYIDQSDLLRGYCKIQLVSQLTLDWIPWTVVTKLQGRDGEISRVTGRNWSTPVPVYYNPLYMWLPLLLILTGSLMLGAAFGPARNRRWAAERATHLRASMRDNMHAGLRRFPSLRKKPPIDTIPAA